MQDVKQFVESRIESLTAELNSMKMGIAARKRLRLKIGDELRAIKEIRATLNRANKSTKMIDRMGLEILETWNENEAILANIQNYRTNSFLELMAMRKSLETFN